MFTVDLHKNHGSPHVSFITLNSDRLNIPGAMSTDSEVVQGYTLLYRFSFMIFFSLYLSKHQSKRNLFFFWLYLFQVSCLQCNYGWCAHTWAIFFFLIFPFRNEILWVLLIISAFVSASASHLFVSASLLITDAVIINIHFGSHISERSWKFFDYHSNFLCVVMNKQKI